MSHSPSADMTLYWNDELSGELLRFLTGRLKCPEAASDIAQETYLRFHQFIQTSPPDNARALAFSIAVNLATDYQRKMKFRQTIVTDDELENLLNSAQTATAVNPERIVMAEQQMHLLKAALDELPPDCRQAFVMHSMGNLTHSQIGARLGVSPTTATRLLVKAMSHCQLRLNSDNPIAVKKRPNTD